MGGHKSRQILACSATLHCITIPSCPTKFWCAENFALGLPETACFRRRYYDLGEHIMRCSSKSARLRATLALTAGLVLPALLLSHGQARADALATRLEERVQVDRNGPRGLEYVPTSRAGSAGTAKRSLKVDVLKKIDLDGSPLDNTYSNLLPLDTNGNHKSELVIWNGFRTMRLYDLNGRKLWQVNNGNARKQGPETFIHRDAAAVLDLDGDKKDDVLHCWQSGSRKRLVARDGATGKEIAHVDLIGQGLSPGNYCRIAVYRKQSDKKPIILVAHNQSGSSKCGRNWVDNWARVVAFDTKLKKLWQTDTCDAGHHTAGVDANHDGLMEYFFAGKYALDFNGKIRCTLSGWNKSDHVDGIRVAQFDPKKKGMQAMAVGRTDAAMFDAATCKRIWTAPSVVKNPQEVVVGQFDPAPKPLSIMISERSTRGKSSTYILTSSGKLTRTIKGREILSMQNADLDGDHRTDEVVAIFGEVFNGKGDKILSKDWYWNLKGKKVAEKKTNNVYDRWVSYPVLFDVDHDGRQELVTWGQSLIVVGRPH